MKRVLTRARRGWLRFATMLGTFQMVVLLSLIYWVVVPVIALPYKVLADPLRLRRSGAPLWVVRTPDNSMQGMRRQG